MTKRLTLEELNIRLSIIENKLGIQSDKNNLKENEVVEISPFITAYDEYIQTYLNPFISISNEINESEIIKYTKIIEKIFSYQREYLIRASKCRKPLQLNIPSDPILENIAKTIKEMSTLRDNRSEYINHQNMIYEGLQSISWLIIEPTPVSFIESYIDGSDFWGNKIRVKYKNINDNYIKYVNAYKNLLIHLMEYVKSNHKTGLTYNPKGIDINSYTPETNNDKEISMKDEKKDVTPNLNNIFAGIQSIDQSQGFTAGLKKVTKDMQTWRKEYNADKPIPKTELKENKKVNVQQNDTNLKPVYEEKNGNLYIENQFNRIFDDSNSQNKNILNIRQQVYLYNCKDSTIILKGKGKNITVDKCTNIKLLFDDLVSCIEIVNCKKVKIQCFGIVPSIAIDKTDGILVYLSYNGKKVTNFVTSKSSEMNVSFPENDKEGSSYIEIPIPEQFMHKISEETGKIISKVSELYS